MTTNMLYCNKCRDTYGHHIAAGKFGPDIFRRVVVTSHNSNGSYRCKCEGCGHTWNSRSPEAQVLFDGGRHPS